MSDIQWVNPEYTKRLASDLAEAKKLNNYDDHYSSKEIEPILVIEETMGCKRGYLTKYVIEVMTARFNDIKEGVNE